MRLVIHFLATLTLGTVLGVVAAPVASAMRPDHLQYADNPTYRKESADLEQMLCTR